MPDQRNPQGFSQSVISYGGSMLASFSNVASTFWHGSSRSIDATDIYKRIEVLKAESAAEISARLARGNTSIQDGWVVSAEEIDREFGPAPWRR